MFCSCPIAVTISDVVNGAISHLVTYFDDWVDTARLVIANSLAKETAADRSRQQTWRQTNGWTAVSRVS
jgi:hypothetical protein